MATRSKVKEEGLGQREPKVELEEGTIVWGLGRYFTPAGAGVGDFVELLITDGRMPYKFDNVLGKCKELICRGKGHEGLIFHIEALEGEDAKEEYLREMACKK